MPPDADTRRVLFVLSSLRCIDGIASHLAMLVPALKERDWKVFFVAGAVDCPPAAAHVLAAIRGGSEQFVVDEAFSNEIKLTPGRFARHVTRSRGWAKQFGARVIHLQNRSLGPPTFAARAIGGPPRVYTKQLADPPHAAKPRNLMSSTYGKLWGERVIAISGAMAVDLQASDRVDSATSATSRTAPTPASSAAPRPTSGPPPARNSASAPTRSSPRNWPAWPTSSGRRPSPPRARNCGKKASTCWPCFAGFCEPAEADKLYAAANGRQDAFKILGQQNARDVLWAADVKTLCSEREGFPSAIVEAMGCGVVPVRTKVEGAADQIDEGVTGFLFDVGDEKKLTDILRMLYHDRSKLHQISLAAECEAKERFDSGIMAEKTISIYEELNQWQTPRPANGRAFVGSALADRCGLRPARSAKADPTVKRQALSCPTGLRR